MSVELMADWNLGSSGSGRSCLGLRPLWNYDRSGSGFRIPQDAIPVRYMCCEPPAKLAGENGLDLNTLHGVRAPGWGHHPRCVAFSRNSWERRLPTPFSPVPDASPWISLTAGCWAAYQSAAFCVSAGEVNFKLAPI